MRTTQLITGYISAAFFLLLGIRSIQGWMRQKDTTSAHLALATGSFGVSTLIGAITTTLIDSTKGEVAPRWEQILSSILILLAVYEFLLFLSDFVKFPQWLRALFGVGTIVWIVLSVIERPDLTFDQNFKQVPIRGVHNPIHYLTFVGAFLVYLAVVFGILWIVFLINGARLRGLARFRMFFIAAGFFLLFVAVGLLPRILFGSPNENTVKTVFQIVEWVAVASAPLLFVGFTPPAFVARLVTSRSCPHASA
jgi:hypothetical protein